VCGRAPDRVVASMNRRTAALLRADGRMVADAALLRPLGGRMMLEFNHAIPS
jgi:hypothetical protein